MIVLLIKGQSDVDLYIYLMLYRLQPHMRTPLELEWFVLPVSYQSAIAHVWCCYTPPPSRRNTILRG